MKRDEMIETLLPAIVNSGETLTSARRRLWRMSDGALEREMLMRGLVDYDDPAPNDEEDDGAQDDCGGYAALGWSQAPVYQD
jgi:hypothetical protein